MAETPEGRRLNTREQRNRNKWTGSFVPAFNDDKLFLYQRDGSFGYHLLNIYKAPHPSTNQKNRPFDIELSTIRHLRWRVSEGAAWVNSMRRGCVINLKYDTASIIFGG